MQDQTIQTIQSKLRTVISDIVGIEDGYLDVKLILNSQRLNIQIEGILLTARYSLLGLQDIAAMHDINIEEEVYESLLYEASFELDNDPKLKQTILNSCIEYKLDKMDL